MKKAAVAAIALAGATAFTGAQAAPAAAPAPAARAAHTLKWVLHETGSHDVGKFGFVGTDSVRSRKTHKIVGYDSNTGRFFPKTSTATLTAAFSLKGGVLLVNVTGSFTPGASTVFRGQVHGGTGKFKGVHGVVVAKNAPHDDSKTFVTVRYH